MGWASEPLLDTLPCQLVQDIEVAMAPSGAMAFCSYLQYKFRSSMDMPRHILTLEHTSRRATNLKDICGSDSFTQMLLNSTDYDSYRNSTTGIFKWISNTYRNLLSTARIRLQDIIVV